MRIVSAIIVMLCAMSAFAQIPTNLPEVRCNQQSDGFCDILLVVEQKSTVEDGTLMITVAGTHKNESLELRIALAPKMKAGDMNPITLAPQPYSLRRGGVRFERTGPASDRLISRIAELYQTKAHPKAMVNDIPFTAFAFRGNPEKIASREVLFELSRNDPANAVPQCELLLDVNLPTNEIRIREKNQDSRDCVVRILGQSD